MEKEMQKRFLFGFWSEIRRCDENLKGFFMVYSEQIQSLIFAVKTNPAETSRRFPRRTHPGTCGKFPLLAAGEVIYPYARTSEKITPSFNALYQHATLLPSFLRCRDTEYLLFQWQKKFPSMLNARGIAKPAS
jgi:hypothetical protein